jgi:hypothetical protein
LMWWSLACEVAELAPFFGQFKGPCAPSRKRLEGRDRQGWRRSRRLDLPLARRGAVPTSAAGPSDAGSIHDRLIAVR